MTDRHKDTTQTQRRTRQWELTPEKLTPEDREELKDALERSGAKNIEVYPGALKAQTETIFRVEGASASQSFAAPSDLLAWLEAGDAQGPLVIEAELPPLDTKSEAQPRDWHDEFTSVRKHWSDGELALKFGNAWKAVKLLAQANDPLVIEERIANLWRMYPEAAEKLGLPKPLLSNRLETTTPRTVELTEREAKIWGVIQQGSTGLQYCRELDNAGIAPQRSGAWKDCPRKYASAYKEGQPWPHRIQDEKSKVRRKAQLAGLASE